MLLFPAEQHTDGNTGAENEQFQNGDQQDSGGLAVAGFGCSIRSGSAHGAVMFDGQTVHIGDLDILDIAYVLLNTAVDFVHGDGLVILSQILICTIGSANQGGQAQSYQQGQAKGDGKNSLHNNNLISIVMESIPVQRI